MQYTVIICDKKITQIYVLEFFLNITNSFTSKVCAWDLSIRVRLFSHLIRFVLMHKNEYTFVFPCVAF